MIITIIGICKTAQGQIYSYTNATSGAPNYVDPNAIGGNLTRVNGANAPGSPCATGFSTTNHPSTATFGTGLTAVELTVTPNASYQLNVSDFSVDLRRTGTGPVMARLAYSIDGGTTWIDKGSNDTPNNASCGSTATATWNPTDFSICNPSVLKFRVYLFNASSTGGNAQILNLIINGTVTLCCTPPADPSGTITVAANPACGPTTLSYSSPSTTSYWQTSSSGTSTSQNTMTNYTTTSTAGIYTYYVREYDGTCWSSGNVNSGAVSINTPVSITTQPSTTDVSICSGVSISTLTVTATGTGLTYDWYINTTNSNSGGTSLGVTTNTYTPSNTLIGTNYYYCVVSGAAPCTSVTSNVSGAIEVLTAPANPPAPTPTANPSCDFTELQVMVPPANVTYYWHGTFSNSTNISLPTSSSYSIGASNTYYVRAKHNSGNCWSSSVPIVVTVNKSPNVTSHPSDKVICSATNTTFTVSAIGTGLTYQWYVDVDGTGPSVPVALTNVAPYSNVTTATLSITNATLAMNGYNYYCVVSGASPCSPATSSSGVLSVNAAGEPTTAASAVSTSDISCNGMNISWTNGNGNSRLVVMRANNTPVSPTDGVSYTANPMFGSGTNLGSNSYAVYAGTDNSVFVYGLNPSTTYEFLVFEYNGCGYNYLTSGTIPGNTATTTACTDPAGITALYVDACGGSCNFEGNNELIWMTSGSYAIPVRNSSPVIHYNVSPNPTSVAISNYTSNSANTATLNNSVGVCGTTTFYDAFDLGYIPPNSSFLLANNCMCRPLDAYDLSNMCGQGPIYVYYGTNAAWPCGSNGGIFGNSSTSPNPDEVYFDADFSAVIPGLDPEYDYDKYILSSGNGAYITLDPAGGSATSYGANSCAVPLIVLPIELKYFHGVPKANSIKIEWETMSETNLNRFEIEKSRDGINYFKLAALDAQNSFIGAYYEMFDETPFVGANYFKLFSVDNDGKRTYQRTILVNYLVDKNETHTITYDGNYLIISLEEVSFYTELSIYSVTGQLYKKYSASEMENGKIVLDASIMAKGIYLLKINQKYSSIGDKIIIR